MLKLYCTLVVLFVHTVCSLNLPGPLVYVVTPSPRTPSQHEGRSAPFYYRNWVRRMDSPTNATTSTTTQRVETPDLIFAEFESDNGDHMRKSLRKLLEKERIEAKPSTTPKPIYVPDETRFRPLVSEDNYALPKLEETKPDPESTQSVMDDYLNMYNVYNAPAPVYTPSSTSKPTTVSTTVNTTTITTPAPNVENIWHIIDSEKYNQNPGNWEEIPLNEDHSGNPKEITPEKDEKKLDDGIIDDNFALPGFATNPGPAENESRAIRTEPNFRFPYVNLKTFQMKNSKPLINSYANNKKSGSNSNMYTSLDNFRDIKNPVRGEAQDVMTPQRQPIDRYNPAQPYLPDYGTKSKQSSPDVATPVKSVANLVPPPPPPPPPRASVNDLLPPTNYESFPPYNPPVPDTPPSPPVSKPSTMHQPPQMTDDDSMPNSDDEGPPMDLGYRYKPPSLSFRPTLPPVEAMNKPFLGYSYNKPSMDDAPVQPFIGYSYDKPSMNDAPPVKPYKAYSPPMDDSPPPMDKPMTYGGYNYDKPSKPEKMPSYGPHHDHPPYPSHDQDYPELVFDKHHGEKVGDDMKPDDMGMVPPPPDMKPDMTPDAPDDHGFPHDFPGDFKYHDFDDHDHDHYHHHHHTTTTTTTTEMPRVNRYSYYYLGKKLYYLPLYFSVYFIVYVGALIIKAVLRHKIVYPNSWRPNDQTASFFSKRSVDNEWDLSNEKLHEVTGVVTKALATAAEKYMTRDKDA